jgi:thioesterase domain-containing protein
VLVRSEQQEHWAATRLDDPLKGWARWTNHPVQVIGVPVGHMDIFSEENLNRMVREMRDAVRIDGLSKPDRSISGRPILSRSAG